MGLLSVFEKCREKFLLSYWEQQTGSLGGAVYNYSSVFGEFFGGKDSDVIRTVRQNST